MKEFLDSVLGVALIPICFGVAAFVWWMMMRNVDFTIWPALSFALLLLPVFLPYVLFHLTYERWQEFTQTRNKQRAGRVTLRIKPPPDVFKSPEAMETVLAQINNTSKADNFMEAYIGGKHPLSISLELVSIGGDVRMYVNVPRKQIKDILEAQLYAQYPGIEITEEPIDYAAEIQWNEDEMDLMSFHAVKADEEVLPIKTYIDLGFDRMPKEEEKVEPMAPIIEFLSKAKPHERIIYQFICAPHVKKEFKLGTSLKTKPTWKKAAQRKINELMYRDENRLSIRAEDEEEKDARPSLTMGERDLVSAIERNTGKLAYVTGIRIMLITLDKTQFDGGKIAPLLKVFYPFDDQNRNQIGIRWKTDFDYMFFEDFTGTKKTARKKRELEHFKLRKYDAGDGKVNKIHQPTVFSVEELATIFHVPGRSVITPQLGRVASARGNAPDNLPIGELPS